METEFDLNEYVVEDISEITSHNLTSHNKEVVSSSGAVVVRTDALDDPLESDFNSSRENMHSLIESAKDALEEAITLAKSSDQPRAWEVVATLIKTITDANQVLINNHGLKADAKKKNKANGEEPVQGPSQVTNNNVFVGSTEELFDMLNGTKTVK